MSDIKFGYSSYLTDRVEELLTEGTLDEILKLIEKDLDLEWKATPPDDPKARELIYHEVHALNRLHLKMASIVDSLKFAKREGRENGRT
jgi:hypothetical protein